MPTYEYKCEACQHRFDVMQSFSESPITECPECKDTVQRVIGKNVLVHFKGDGFYVNDHNKSAACPKTDSSETCKTCPHAS